MRRNEEPYKDSKRQAVRALARLDNAVTHAAAGDACPDAEQLGALVEHRLLDAELDPVQRHVASCASCRAVVAVLVGDPGVVRALARSTRRTWWLAAAAAAVIVAGATGVFWRVRHTADTPFATRLVAAAATLLEREPVAFAGFRPLTEDERNATPDVVRAPGSLHLALPKGRTLESRPQVRFCATPGPHTYRLTITSADGGDVAQTDLAPPQPGTTIVVLAWPLAAPLTDGETYVVRLRVDGPLGPEESVQTCVVATERERAEYARAITCIDEVAPSDLAPALRVDFALRGRLWSQAIRHGDAWISAAPDDSHARATLRLVTQSLGLDQDRP